MNKLKLTLVFLLIATVTFAQKSPRKQASGTIEGATVSIDYGAPSVKGRTIWGGLEKYGKVWRAGANENTTFSFEKDVKIGDKIVPAGKYGFFIIPNKDKEWVIILNSKNDSWGAYSYNKNEDILRLNIKPEIVSENQEVLEYKIGDRTIEFSWEKIRIIIPIE
ncbi:Protein of unknown function (DUF2911) [Lutibacter oceani]|uniref:DUF2911 family protein n=1 Tax=Lutibacter oceani TaxID=1853311 RepID=A0A3D9RJP1_9FLAO|nr:DUF2911 domain-containing protein [Lutibacter oceani]REE79748.1 Protein of unknown function (DUF2911) [Lutibacter oceani]